MYSKLFELRYDIKFNSNDDTFSPLELRSFNDLENLFFRFSLYSGVFNRFFKFSIYLIYSNVPFRFAQFCFNLFLVSSL